MHQQTLNRDRLWILNIKVQYSSPCARHGDEGIAPLILNIRARCELMVTPQVP